MDEKHCVTCDCFARVWGIKRHKVVKFLLRWACIPYMFVSVFVFAFHIHKTLNDLVIPMYWMLLVSVTVNWIWILLGLIIPCIETIKLLAEGCAAWLLDMASRFYRCFCFFCRYFYNERRNTDESRCYSLEHVVADSPDASPEMYSNENPPPLPERHGSIVGMKESPIIYDLPSKFKRNSQRTSDFKNSPAKSHQDDVLSSTWPKTGHTSGTTVALSKTGRTSGATGARPKTGLGRSSPRTRPKSGHTRDATDTWFKTASSNIDTGARSKIGHTDSATDTSSKTDHSRLATSVMNTMSSSLGARPKTSPMSSNLGARPKTSPMSSNLGARPKTSPMSSNLGARLNISPKSSNLSTTPKSSPKPGNLGATPKTSPSYDFGATVKISPTSSYFGATLGATASGESLDTKPKTIRCLFPDSGSSLLSASFGTTIDETENVHDSICQLDLSHINISISSTSSVIPEHLIKDPSNDTIQLNPLSSDTEKLLNNPRASSIEATLLTSDICAEQSVSGYVPFVPDNQMQSPQDLIFKDRIFKDSENNYSVFQSNFSQINVPVSTSAQYLMSDPPRVRISPQGCPSDPPRVRISPQVSSSEHPGVNMSPQSPPSYLSRERISPKALLSDPTRVKVSPEASVSDLARLEPNPKILKLDSKEVRSNLEAPSVRHFQSSYIPFVPDSNRQNTSQVANLPDSDRQNTHHIPVIIKSEHHETNLFTSSFGKTTETTENIEESILQLDASHIHIQIFSQTEQASSPQPVISKFTAHALAPGSPHLKTSQLASEPGSQHLKSTLDSAPGSPHLKASLRASAPGSPHLKASPQESVPGSPHLKTSPLASSPGSPQLKTSPLASAPGSPQLKTSPLASAPGSPQLKTSPLAFAIGSPQLKTCPIASVPGSQDFKTNPQNSAPGSPYLNMSPQDSAPGSPHLKMSPQDSAQGSPYLKTISLYPPSSPVSSTSHKQVQVGASESSSLNITRSQVSATCSIQLRTSPRASSYVTLAPNQPEQTRIISSGHKLDQSDDFRRSSTEEYQVNIHSDRKDEKCSIYNFSDKERREIFNLGQQISEKDLHGLQPNSEGQINKDLARTYTKFSVSKNIGREENSVPGFNDKLPPATVCLSSSDSPECNDRNDLQESKLRRRIRASSDKCDFKKPLPVSATIRSKTF